MEQYQTLLRHILENGTDKGDRTGTGTISVFGYQNRYDLAKGFPIVTTKRIPFRVIAEELFWFIRGETSIIPLLKKNVHIWDDWPYAKFKSSNEFKGETMKEFTDRMLAESEFAKEYEDLGPVYGKQWRNFGGVDQLVEIQQRIRDKPNDRRLIISAWNPPEVPDMTLPPCHAFMQFYVANKKLSCHMYQRSADAFLGVPFNIAGYALLTHMMAQATNNEPGDFVHSFGDLHIYKNHIKQVEEQLSREPKPLPKLSLNKEKKDVRDFTIDDVILEGYDPHPKIEAPVAV